MQVIYPGQWDVTYQLSIFPLQLLFWIGLLIGTIGFVIWFFKKSRTWLILLSSISTLFIIPLIYNLVVFRLDFNTIENEFVGYYKSKSGLFIHLKDDNTWVSDNTNLVCFSGNWHLRIDEHGSRIQLNGECPCGNDPYANYPSAVKENECTEKMALSSGKSTPAKIIIQSLTGNTISFERAPNKS